MGQHHSGEGGQPTAHLGTGYAVQGAARPAAPPPAPAAARTGPTPRPPAGLGAAPRALSPASREPGQGQGGRRKGASLSGRQNPWTSSAQGSRTDLATLRPKAATRAILLTLLVRLGAALIESTRNSPWQPGPTWTARPSAGPSHGPSQQQGSMARNHVSRNMVSKPQARDVFLASSCSWPARVVSHGGPGSKPVHTRDVSPLNGCTLHGGLHTMQPCQQVSDSGVFRKHQERRPGVPQPSLCGEGDFTSFVPNMCHVVLASSPCTPTAPK